jgi:acetoin utilization protein AcuB
MMVRDLSTVGPLDTLENAAREIHDRKIGCLPVVDEDGLAGIITSSDMLRTLIQLVGGDGPGTWLEVEVPNEPGQLAGLTDTIRDLKVNVGGIYLGPASRETYRTIVVRLETTNPSAIVKNLEGAGYKITTVESSKPSGGPYEE